MPELGYFAVVVALALSAFAATASAVGAARGSGELAASGRRAMVGVAVVTSIAVAALAWSFLAHDFSVSYVWQTSNTTTPPFYLLTGVWGGQPGSLLFWSWLLALYTAAALLRRWRADSALLAPFTAICALVTGFFLFLVAFVANPFARLGVMPLEGNGLNPLLQHPGMAFHPPALYLGLTGMVIPYAFGMAALVSGRTDAAWLHAARRWLLVAWCFLSIGLALGGRWAYDVLGWGGYWAWDPVENAALMPWLAATAFLHSAMVQERRGIFKVWNMGLIILTFCLVIIGTFLTRAGLVSSVHAFAQSDIGPYFLVFTATVLFASLALLWRRLGDLRGEERVETLWSREAAFLGNNLVLLGALFGVFWGTLFPLFSEIVTGQRATVRAPYFNTVVVPLFWAAIVLMAVAPLVGWRRADPAQVGRDLARPMLATLAIVVALYAAGVQNWVALAGFAGAILALIVTVLEIVRGVRARMARGEGAALAIGRLFARNRRRYGGYVVHIGVALMAMGIVGSTVYRLETERALAVGDAVTVGGFVLTYRGLDLVDAADRQSVVAALEVQRDGQVLGTLGPRRDVFRLREDQPMSIPAVMHRPLEDVYTLLGTFDGTTEQVTVKVFVNPLVSWLWIGLVVLVAGTVVAAWPDAAEERVMNAEVRRLLAPLGSAPQ